MAAQGDQQIFPNAKNVVISGGTFNNIKLANSERDGFKRLLKNICESAFHDAAERGDPPRCHPHTRVAIREEILKWVQAPHSMRKLILWIYGPAGAGKTAIAQSIAEELEKLGLLVASFFFWRTATGRNNTSKFIATIAYQLSRYIPQIEDHLITAIERDPTIFSRSLSTQMRILVIIPLKAAAPSLSTPMAAIVDGVDECSPRESQSELLNVLGQAVSELRHLPLVFLVSSRPEYDIREAFNGNHLFALAKVLVLDNSYKPDNDIKVYFNSTFREIYNMNRRLSSRLPLPWPAPSDIDFLVSKASGQFIFASTVTKFVGSPRHDPVERLNIALRLSNTGNETPFAPLDTLYRFILGSVADINKVLEVLALLVLAGDYVDNLSLDKVQQFLGFDIRRALIDMHALLFVPPTDDDDDCNFLKIRVYHASLSDFLMDRSRSLEYYIGETHGHINLCRLWLRSISPPHCGGYRTPVEAFLYHSSKLDSPGAYQPVVEALACFDLRAALDQISDVSEDLYGPDWYSFMQCAKKLGEGREDIFPRLQKEFNAFILNHADKYPPSLKSYIPTLLYQFFGCGDMLNILLHNVTNSVQELSEFRELDRRLLDVFSINSSHDQDDDCYELLHEVLTAGQCVVDGGSYTALVTTIVNVLWPRPGERSHQIIFASSRTFEKDSSDPTMEIALQNWHYEWFNSLLRSASIDLDLACLLRERVIRFASDVEPRNRWDDIEGVCRKYIKACEKPCLDNAHSEYKYFNNSAICHECVKGWASDSDDAILESSSQPSSPSKHNSDEGTTMREDTDVVMEDTPGIPTQSPPLPSTILELSDADIDLTLALAAEFDITTYPFTHMLQFSPLRSGALSVSFTGDQFPFIYLMS